jgi:hypothetical protein
MHKTIKSKIKSKLLSTLLIGFISMNILTGCALSKKDEVKNETNNEANNEANIDNKNNGDSKEEPDSLQEVITEAYIKAIDSEKQTITVDEVELLFSTDEDRLREIGMKSEDLVTGFYLYNEEEEDDIISYGKNLKIELLEDTVLSEATLEELEEQILNNNELCKITVKDNVVVKISQIYLP